MKHDIYSYEQKEQYVFEYKQLENVVLIARSQGVSKRVGYKN